MKAGDMPGGRLVTGESEQDWMGLRLISELEMSVGISDNLAFIRSTLRYKVSQRVYGRFQSTEVDPRQFGHTTKAPSLYKHTINR
jgi:hypothetical protein